MDYDSRIRAIAASTDELERRQQTALFVVLAKGLYPLVRGLALGPPPWNSTPAEAALAAATRVAIGAPLFNDSELQLQLRESALHGEACPAPESTYVRLAFSSEAADKLGAEEQVTMRLSSLNKKDIAVLKKGLRQILTWGEPNQIPRMNF